MSNTASETISLIIQAIDDTKGVVAKTVSDINNLKSSSDDAAESVDKINKSLSDTAGSADKATKSTKQVKDETKNLSDAVDEATKSVAKEAKELDNAGKETDELGKKTQKAKKDVKDFGEVVSGVVQIISGMAASMATVVAPVIQSAQFERKMKEVGAIAEATKDEMKDLTAAARKMGDETEYSSTDAAQALKDLAAGGFNAKQSIEALPGVLNLAMTDNIALGQAAEFATSILNGMQLPVSQTNRVVDVLAQTSADSASSVTSLAEAMSYAAPVAASIKMPIEQTAAALGILHNNGIKASSAGTNLRGVIMELVDPTEEGKAALAKLGVQIAKNADGSIDFYNTFKRLHDAHMSLAESTAIFNKLNAGAAMIFANSLDKLTEYTDNNAASQGRAAKMAKEFNDSTTGAWRNFTSSVEGAAIEVGNKFMPMIVSTLNVLTSFGNSIANFAKDHATLTKIIGLSVAGLTLYVSGAGLAKIATTAFGGSIMSIVGWMTTARLAISAFVAELWTITAANPAILAVVAVLGAAVIAWNMFSDSTVSASKKHAEAAESFAKAKDSVDEEVSSLKKLQADLLDTSKTSEQHKALEEKLALVLPGVTTKLDDQGRAYGALRNKTDENNKKLQEYIELKEKEAKIDTAHQLEELAKAYSTASQSVKIYRRDREALFGDGKTETTFKQRQEKWLQEITGGYAKFNKNGADAIANMNQQETTFDAFIAKLINSGTSVDQLNAMLNSIHIDEATKQTILDKFNEIASGVKTTVDAAAADLQMQLNSPNVTPETKAQIIGKYQEIASGAKISTAESIDEVNKILNSLSIDDRTKKKILSDYTVMVDGIKTKIADIGVANAVSSQSTNQYTTDQIKEMAKRWDELSQKVKGYSVEITNMQVSLTHELRAMGQTTMSDLGAWADRRKEANEYYDMANKALQEAQKAKDAGNYALAEQKYAEAKDYALQSKDAFKSLNVEIKDGDEVIQDALASQSIAMRGVREAGQLAIDIIKAQRKDAIDGMNDIKNKIGVDSLKATLGDFKVNWDETWATMAESANEQLANIRSWFTDFWKDQRREWVTMWQLPDGSVLKQSGEGITQNTSEPQKFATGGYPRRAGWLPGWGGGDRIRALLEAGEFIVRKEAVAKYGVGLFHALNSMAVGAGAMVKARVGGLIAPVMPSFKISEPARFKTGGDVKGTKQSTPKIVEVKFIDGSLFGDEDSVDSFVNHLSKAGLTA